MKNLIAIMAMLALSFGAQAGTLVLGTESGITSGLIIVNAEIEQAAEVTWTADAFDDLGTPSDVVDVDLGLINPLSTDICGDITGGTTGGTDLALASCDDSSSANDLHVSIEVAGAVSVGGSTTVDVSYTANPTDFGQLDMCDDGAAPALDGTTCTTASETGLIDQDTFTHYLLVGMPLNANSTAGYTPSATNTYGGDIAVDITLN